MRWIKHLTESWDDEKISDAVFDGGLEIYGLYWRILEIIGKQMDHSPKTSCSYPPKVWGKFAGISAKKFQKLSNILEQKKLIISEIDGRNLYISAPNLLKYRDEFTKKRIREGQKNPD